MELRANPNKRVQYQQGVLQNRQEKESKRKQKLFIIYFAAGFSFIALVLIAFVAYKIVYAPVEYQLAPPAASPATKRPGTPVLPSGRMATPPFW